MGYPKIIQGGMGVGVSGWKLARAVTMTGQMGVVSGTGIDTVMVRRLQMGDEAMKEAFDHFPLREVADRVWNRYFVPGGKPAGRAFLAKPIFTFPLKKPVAELIVLANFVEVFLAKSGHSGLVGINLLEKIQIATLPSLLGAMMAGVDYVLMGAGIPREIPAALDALAQGRPAQIKLSVANNGDFAEEYAKLDPAPFVSGERLNRPKFLAILSSSVLAATLARKGIPPPDGFVLEAWTAGGHNAPPRGPAVLDEIGQPVYGSRDEPDYAQMRELGLPFWLAGNFGRAGKLKEALALGAQGIQVGTAFAFCQESGIDRRLKEQVVEQSLAAQVGVFTDPKASPTGYPFKVVDLPGTLSECSIYEHRARVCDLGYLRQLFRKDDGGLAYRCPAEPVDDFIKKGGTEEEAADRKCLCNGLMGTIGLGQDRKEGIEPAIVTAGDNVDSVADIARLRGICYPAQDVVDQLSSGSGPAEA
jgi:nitronate monooxygenase